MATFTWNDVIRKASQRDTNPDDLRRMIDVFELCLLQQENRKRKHFHVNDRVQWLSSFNKQIRTGIVMAIDGDTIHVRPDDMRLSDLRVTAYVARHRCQLV